MNIYMHSQDFGITPSIGRRIQSQLQRALGPYEEEIMSIEVYLTDQNGPRGGADKRCLLRISVRGLPPASAHATHGDLYVAIDRSARKLRRLVKRSLAKRRRFSRGRLVPEPMPAAG